MSPEALCGAQQDLGTLGPRVRANNTGKLNKKELEFFSKGVKDLFLSSLDKIKENKRGFL